MTDATGMGETVEKLLRQQKTLISAGNQLADRALYTTREYDGLHRLASAVAVWIDTVAKLNVKPPAHNKELLR